MEFARRIYMIKRRITGTATLSLVIHECNNTFSTKLRTEGTFVEAGNVGG